MKAKKLYVGADSTEIELGGGAGTAINASVFVDENDNFLIKCNKGEILNTDVIKVARMQTTRYRKMDEESGEKITLHKRGWIEPTAGCIAYHGIAMTIEFFMTKDGSDYWKVLVNGLDIQQHEQNRNEKYQPAKDDDDTDALSRLPYSFRHRQGVAVYRDGVRITDYLQFKVATRENGTCVVTHWV